MSKQIRRITLFKIPTEEGQNALLEKYSTMTVDAKKVRLTIPALNSLRFFLY